MSKREEILRFIREGVRCFDGAMGTMLFRAGLPPGSCPETADPEIIKDIHRQYVQAGAQFVTTNTFGGTRVKLANFGLQDSVYEINKRNAELAKQAEPSREYYVVGDIGPTGEFIQPFGEMTREEFYDVFSEQVKALVDGGVDAFIIETMVSIEEIQSAIKAIRDHCDLPVIACMTFELTPKGFRTIMGVDVKTSVEALKEAGADVIGSNCSLAPREMATLVKEFRSVTELPLIAEPNAGQPKIVDGKTVYELGKDIEEWMKAMIQNGANIVGGCCGTDPDYISRLRRLVDLWNERGGF